MKLKNPFDLVTPFRFDLVIKYMYAKSILKGYQTDYFKRVYKDHLRVWNGFKEYDNPNKNSFESFDQEFQKIINSIKTEGFDSNISEVPILEDKFIVNGAHRVAAALALKKDVAVKPSTSPQDGQKDCSWINLFKGLGLSEKICDQVAIEYAKLKGNTYVVTLFPTTNGEYQKAIDVINKYGNIIYYKRLDLKKHAPLNLMRELYVGESWAGGPENNWVGFRQKQALCYTNDSPTYAFLIELDKMEIARTIKNEIRDIFQVSNHSVHINDTHEQTVRIAKCLFNENSVHHLTHTPPVNFAKFQDCLNRFKKFIVDNGLDLDDYAVTASSVLSIYGLREGQDLDYLHHELKLVSDPYNLIYSHNQYGIGIYDLPYDEIIYNPEFHFYSQGVKFVSPRIVRHLKSKRGEPKDIIDIELIDTIL
jgi:hypothetical protein